MDISKHSSYKDFVWAIELNRLGLEFIGLWPKNDEVTKNSLISDLRVTIVFIIIVPTVIPCLCSLTRVWGDMILMMDNLQITMSLILVMLKFIVMWWKRSAFSSIVKIMLEDWMTLKVDAEMYVMMRRAHIARLIIICEYVMLILGFIFVILLPACGLPFRQLTNLTDRSRPLPLQTYYFYDTDKSPQYEFTFIIQTMTTFFGMIIYSSADAFLGLSVLHLCGQLENYRHRLVTSSNDMTDISFSRKCLSLIGVLILFTQTFLYCGAGQILTEHSEAIYRAIYNLDWYKLESRKARSSFMLLMIRTKEPFCITAGKIFPLTMTTFCKLLKTTASYMSFLLAMQR